ncbi:MAG: NUDIX hydrolase [Planctomycetaceae bacterium]|nr:NUDIX hydrolase [Planctomycetaceae bacterium]
MCERVDTTGVVTIIAVTADRRLLLTEQFRPPVRRRVIEMPAGLAGDVAGQEHEDLAVAARRELLEETGYECERMDFVAEGPSSSGLTSEIVTFFRATGLRWVGPGGGDGSEDIQLHSIPLSWIRGWLRERETAGILVDPKVYAGLYFLGPG